MHAQVRGLLTFAGSARKDLDAENVSLDECLREALDALSVAIEDEQGRMVWRDGPLPEARGDRVLLVQVFQNLVSNALRYRREEPPVVTVSWERRAGWLRVCVDDNGRGVDPARAEEVFMPFRRAREHGKQGTGLGLAIARRAIGRHGGRIWVEAKAEPGSRFVFTLPESGAAEGAAAGPSEAPRLSMGLQRELEP
jgi:signal transduction histidine kinase